MPALKGAGLLKGLGVTFRTMSRRAATAQYPHVKPDLPARSRGVIALVEENCTVCMLCSRECPDWCIYFDALYWSPEFEYAELTHETLTHEKERLREWAYTVPAPDPLEEGAEEPAELVAARKAQEAVAAKATAAAQAAAAQAAAAAEAPAAEAAAAAGASAGAGASA